MKKYKDNPLILRIGLYACLGLLLGQGGITLIQDTALFISILVTVMIIDVYIKD